MFSALCAVLLASCATSQNWASGGGHSSKSGMSCGGGAQAASSRVDFRLLTLSTHPGSGHYSVGYGRPMGHPGFGGHPCPQTHRRIMLQGHYAQQHQMRHAPRPHPGYQQQRRPYYGHAGNPVMVNGVAFSDQYPGGVRIAPPR